MTCLLPLCIDCQNMHTSVHYKGREPAEIRSLHKIHDECAFRLSEVLQLYKRDLQAIDLTFASQGQFEAILFDLDVAQKNLIGDINQFFHRLKSKCNEYRQMREASEMKESLQTRMTAILHKATALQTQPSPDLLVSVISEKFMNEVQSFSLKVEEAVEKVRKQARFIVVDGNDLQNILKKNIERFMMNAKHLKVKGIYEPDSSATKLQQKSQPIEPSYSNNSKGDSGSVLPILDMKRALRERSPYGEVDLETILRNNTSSVFETNPLLKPKKYEELTARNLSFVNRSPMIPKEKEVDAPAAGTTKVDEMSYTKLSANKYWENNSSKRRSQSTSIIARKELYYT